MNTQPAQGSRLAFAFTAFAIALGGSEQYVRPRHRPLPTPGRGTIASRRWSSSSAR